jgi:hypothetical protein
VIKRTHENGTDNLRAQLDETKQLIGALSLMVAAAIDAKQSNHHTMRVVEFTKYLIEAVNKKVGRWLMSVFLKRKKKNCGLQPVFMIRDDPATILADGKVNKSYFCL